MPDTNRDGTCAETITHRAGGAEACNGIDDDCNGAVDEGLDTMTLYFRSDFDVSYGPALPRRYSLAGWEMPSAISRGTANQTNYQVNPGAEEDLGNNVDDDCNPATLDIGFCGDGTCFDVAE
ncbi:MAG: hypothetical protein IPI43_28185, partial [Sandaracinaceae bacterium]|nr:hypothetical protein [Sandaracinaceae bacterium]